MSAGVRGSSVAPEHRFAEADGVLAGTELKMDFSDQVSCLEATQKAALNASRKDLFV